MGDLFFHRDPEELKKADEEQQQAAKLDEGMAAAPTTDGVNYDGDMYGAPDGDFGQGVGVDAGYDATAGYDAEVPVGGDATPGAAAPVYGAGCDGDEAPGTGWD